MDDDLDAYIRHESFQTQKPFWGRCGSRGNEMLRHSPLRVLSQWNPRSVNSREEAGTKGARPAFIPVLSRSLPSGVTRTGPLGRKHFGCS
jgi:hypothetical protein